VDQKESGLKSDSQIPNYIQITNSNLK